jgi:hypothetical protein
VCPAGSGAAPAKAKLPLAHLADHPAAVKALAEALVPGLQLPGLLVLERLEGQKVLLVRGWGCVAAAGLPRPCAAHGMCASSKFLAGFGKAAAEHWCHHLAHYAYVPSPRVMAPLRSQGQATPAICCPVGM